MSDALGRLSGRERIELHFVPEAFPVDALPYRDNEQSTRVFVTNEREVSTYKQSDRKHKCRRKVHESQSAHQEMVARFAASRC